MRAYFNWLFGISGADFAGTDGWSLRFTGIPENLWLLMGILAAFGLTAWLVVRSYLREGKRSRRLKLTIAAFRLAVLLLLLLIALQPALVLRFLHLQTSAVVVLVDDTLSMRWQDRYSDPAQRGELARRLGLDSSVFGTDARPTRTELVRRALLAEQGPLVKLLRDHPVILARFGVTGRDATAYTEPVATLEEAVAADAADQDRAAAFMAEAREGLDALGAPGYHTHLARAIRETLNRLEGRRLAAIVIVSDGQTTIGGPLAGAVQMAQQRAVPMFTVAVGDPIPPRNIMVAQLQGPRQAREKSNISFTAFVTHRNLPRTTVTVKLMRSLMGSEEWTDTDTAVDITIGGDAGAVEGDVTAGTLQEVPLGTEAPGVGTYIYKAVIEPLADEMIVTDNEASTITKVTDQKMTILLIAGDANWEFQYLRNYLLKTSDHYAVSVWQQNADAKFNQDASTGMKLTALPETREELFKYDVVILHDPRHDPDGMNSAFVAMLDEFAGKHHGGVCYIAGNKFTSKYVTVGGDFAPLTDLLPVVMARADSALAMSLEVSKEPAKVIPTPTGLYHPVMQLDTRPRENEKMWQRLPGIYRSQAVSRLKTLATALAVSGDSTRVTEDRQREPLLAVQYYGKGRVVYMGFNSTWRWRSIDDAELYEKYWGNLVDFLGAGRLEKRRILITTGGDVFDAGSDLRVRAEAYQRDYTYMQSKTLTVSMRNIATAESANYTLEQEKPGFYSGTIPATEIGTFEITAVADDSGLADWVPDDVAMRRIDVRLPQSELQRPEANYNTLRELAIEKDRFLPLREIDALADRIPIAQSTLSTEVPHTLWNTMAVLILLGLLLLTEWTLRKWYNMM